MVSTRWRIDSMPDRIFPMTSRACSRIGGCFCRLQEREAYIKCLSLKSRPVPSASALGASPIVLSGFTNVGLVHRDLLSALLSNGFLLS